MGPTDADDFFGRDAEIAAVVDRLMRSGLVALTGASGSGKSSLALAGIVPMVKAQGWTVDIVRPRDHARDVFDAPAERHLIVIDQLEELFHLALGEGEPEVFGERLEAHLRAGGSLLLTVRSDFLDRCAAVPALARLIAEGVHVVGPLTSDGLRRAVEGPADRVGLRLEPGLTDLIRRDAAVTQGALPQLSHALLEMWQRREGSVLTISGYEASRRRIELDRHLGGGSLRDPLARRAVELPLDHAAARVIRPRRTRDAPTAGIADPRRDPGAA